MPKLYINNWLHIHIYTHVHTLVANYIYLIIFFKFVVIIKYLRIFSVQILLIILPFVIHYTQKH